MNFKRNIIGAMVTTALMASSASSMADTTPRSPTDKPNVIIVYLDDVGFNDISVNGGKYNTKHIDQMAKEGKNFSEFYTSSPVSSPSRAGMLTSRLGDKTDMWGNIMPVFFESDPDGLPKHEVTIAEMLRDNGYDTAMLGKWHLGIGSDDTHIPTRHGFNEWYGIPTSNDMFFSRPDFDNDSVLQLFVKDQKKAMQILGERELILYNNDTVGEVKNSDWNVPVYDAKINKDGSYDDTVEGFMEQTTFQKNITERAVSYIEDNADKPFFLYFSPPQNHIPLFMSEQFKGTTDTPYGDVMMEIDWSMGQINKALEKSGIEDNTIVIFSSDNGAWSNYTHLGAAGSNLPFRDGKNSTYEGGVRVPSIIKWSGQIDTGTVSGIASTLDLMPTIATLTGSDMPKIESDGFDISSTLLNNSALQRQAIPYYYMGQLQAYRSGDYKVHFITSGLFGKKILETPELYNLSNDVSERVNVASQEPEILEQIVAEAKAFHSTRNYATPSFNFGKQQNY